MLCPKCNSNNRPEAEWCAYCGANLKELNSGRRINSNRAFSNKNAAPVKSDTQVLHTDEVNGQASNEGLNPYRSDYPQNDTKNNKPKIIAAICVGVAAVVIILGLLVYKFVFSNNPAKDKEPKPTKPAVSETESKIKELSLEAESSMDAGHYEEAETLYNELRRLTDDEEVSLIYEILYNYNRAVAEYNNENFENAENFYDKIPPEYADYDISSDIDDLYDDIKLSQDAEKELQKIEDYIKDEDIKSAREAIDKIDDRHLSSTGKDKLNELIKDLETLEDNEKSEDYPKSGKGYLEFDDAQSIVKNYCAQMVNAINAGNFNIVSPYILSSSDFSKEQSDLIKMYVSQGITETFDSVKLNALTKISDTKWKADVIEKETIFYADGTSVSKTFNWQYTIEYHNRRFYITDMQ